MSASSESPDDKRSGNVRKVGRRKRRNKQSRSITSTDQVFLTQTNASESCVPLNLTVTKTDIETDEEMAVFGEAVSTESVTDDTTSIPANTDLNNNDTADTNSECYSLKHKKFRKRSFVSSDCCNNSKFCEIDHSVEDDASGKKLKNLPIKKRRKFLNNRDDASHSGESHSRNEDELLSNDTKNVGYEQRLSKSKSHESLTNTQCVTKSSTSQFSVSDSNNNKEDAEVSQQGVNNEKTRDSRQVKREPSFRMSEQNYYTDKDGNANNPKCGWFFSNRIANSSNSSPPRVSNNTNSPLIKSGAIDSSKCSMANVSKTNGDKFMTTTAIKCESHLDIGLNEAKIQGQTINDHPKTMSVEDKECASRKHGFYQKRKTSDATCSQCLHSTTHAYKVTGAVTRKITKPCYSFQGNRSESKFDWTLKSNDRGLNYSSYLENSDNFSEYQNFLPVRGSFQPFPKNCYVEEAGLRDNYPSRARSKLKYERDTDKYNQAICAAGPDMAEGNVD